MKELVNYLKQTIEAFNKLEEETGRTNSYGQGAKDAYKDVLDEIQSLRKKAKSGVER